MAATGKRFTAEEALCSVVELELEMTKVMERIRTSVWRMQRCFFLDQNELELDGTTFDVAPLPVNRVRVCDGVTRRHGVRIRGGKRRCMFMGATPADLKTHRQEELENVWIEQDAEPEIPNFTGNAGIKVQPLENPNIFDIFQLFVTDELYDILVEQTNCMQLNILILILN